MRIFMLISIALCITILSKRQTVIQKKINHTKPFVSGDIEGISSIQ